MKGALCPDTFIFFALPCPIPACSNSFSGVELSPSNGKTLLYCVTVTPFRTEHLSKQQIEAGLTKEHHRASKPLPGAGNVGHRATHPLAFVQ